MIKLEDVALAFDQRSNKGNVRDFAFEDEVYRLRVVGPDDRRIEHASVVQRQKVGLVPGDVLFPHHRAGRTVHLEQETENPRQ